MSDEEWPYEKTEKRMAIAAVAAKTEPELLAAIDHQDHATRVVYADWLEEQGDERRAEFVRLQDELLALPAGRERDAARSRAVHLARDFDPAWRVLVVRLPIQNCARTDCPREWGSLGSTYTSDLRTCGACRANIEYRFVPVDPRTHGPYVLDGAYDEWRPPDHYED